MAWWGMAGFLQAGGDGGPMRQARGAAGLGHSVVQSWPLNRTAQAHAQRAASAALVAARV